MNVKLEINKILPMSTNSSVVIVLNANKIIVKNIFNIIKIPKPKPMKYL